MSALPAIPAVCPASGEEKCADAVSGGPPETTRRRHVLPAATPTVWQRLCQGAADYLTRFGKIMPERQREVLLRLLRCRTAALGGQVYRCDCGHLEHRYHSCNDRHCPLCGQADADEWLRRQSARLLLPVPYFLVTFTVPEQLREFLRAHPELGLGLLFSSAAGAMQDLAGNPRHLGAQLGMLGVLHTWSRTLAYHPHIHFLVPGGGLRWTGASGSPPATASCCRSSPWACA